MCVCVRICTCVCGCCAGYVIYVYVAGVYYVSVKRKGAGVCRVRGGYVCIARVRVLCCLCQK